MTLHQEAVGASGGGTSVDRTALHQTAVEASGGGTSVDRSGGMNFRSEGYFTTFPIYVFRGPPNFRYE